MALQLGSGIWCFSETHLTTVLQRTVAATLSGLGRQLHRQVRAHILVPRWTFVVTPFKLALGVELASSVTALQGKSRFPGRMGNAHPGD